MAENLLNFSIPLDVNVLEQVVQSVYQGSPQQVTRFPQPCAPPQLKSRHAPLGELHPSIL